MDDPSTRHTGVCPDFAVMRVDAFSLQVDCDHLCFIVATERSDENRLHACELGQQRENLGIKLAKDQGHCMEWHYDIGRTASCFLDGPGTDGAGGRRVSWNCQSVSDKESSGG